MYSNRIVSNISILYHFLVGTVRERSPSTEMILPTRTRPNSTTPIVCPRDKSILYANCGVGLHSLYSCILRRECHFTRSEQEDVNDPVTYAVSTIDLYKGDQITAQRLTITTAGSSAACGIYMELGEEYLIGVFQDETTGVLTANTCGLFRSWSDVTKEDVALLENGCGSDNGCDRACDEYQVGGMR